MIEKQLFIVRAEVELVVHAVDEDSAIRIARKGVHEEIDIGNVEFDVTAVRRVTQLTPSMTDSYPYTTTFSEERVAEIIRKNHAQYCGERDCPKCNPLEEASA